MNYVYKKISVTTDALKNLICLKNTPIDTMRLRPVGYKQNDKCPKVEEYWGTIPFGHTVNRRDSHFWIYCKVKTPKKTTDHQKVYYTLRTGREGRWDGTNPQALLYINGKAVQGLDVNHTDVELEFDKEYDLYLYFYTGMEEANILIEPSIMVVDTKIEHLYYDMRVPFESLSCLDENDDDAVTTAKYLEMACNLIDLRQPYSKEFYNSIDEAIGFLKTEYYENPKVCGKGNAEVSCIGHTHIDVAWKWTIAQTEEKAQRSFATVLKLMDDGYDEYKFMSSQPQLYDYV